MSRENVFQRKNSDIKVISKFSATKTDIHPKNNVVR